MNEDSTNDNIVFEIKTDNDYLDYCKCMQIKYNELKTKVQKLESREKTYKKKELYYKKKIELYKANNELYKANNELDNKFKLLNDRKLILDEMIKDIYHFLEKKNRYNYGGPPSLYNSPRARLLRNRSRYLDNNGIIKNSQNIKYIAENELHNRNLRLRVKKIELKRLLQDINKFN